jgi:urease accessory protein
MKRATLVVEKTIASSVLIIGILIMFRERVNFTVALVLLAIFGAFHGYAHGAEMDPDNTALKYVTGYTLGALLVGTAGALIAKVLYLISSRSLLFTIAGTIVAGLGIFILLG